MHQNALRAPKSDRRSPNPPQAKKAAAALRGFCVFCYLGLQASLSDGIYRIKCPILEHSIVRLTEIRTLRAGNSFLGSSNPVLVELPVKC
jgi:hypothetical protein